MNTILSTIVGLVGLVSLAAAIYVWRKQVHPLGDGDVPIVITGGSVALEFDHAHFPPHGNTHSHRGKIARIDIVDKTTWKWYAADLPAIVPASGKRTIIIACDNPNTPKTFDIKLEGDGNNNVTLDFDHDWLPPDSPNSNKHINPVYKIVSMRAIDENGNLIPCHIEDGTDADVKWSEFKGGNYIIHIK